MPATARGEVVRAAPRAAAVAPRVMHVLAPARIGGLENVVYSLATGRAARGLPVDVVAVLGAGPADHPFVERLRAAGLAVHTILAGGRAYVRERRALRALCEQLLPDVVHTHGYHADVALAGAARELGLPTVSTVHGFTRGGWKNRLYEWLQRRAYRRFAAVAAVSRPQVAELLHSGVPSARLIHVPNAWCGGVDRLPAREARAGLGAPDDAFHLGWVGRLSAEKAPVLFVEALAELRDLPVHATLVGDGHERGALEARCRELGLAGRVAFAGSVNDAARLYAAFDAFVLSSRTEGVPIVLFEAMDAGVPIVAARVGGVPDVVGEGEAVLVEPESPQALARAIRAVFEDRDAAAARAAAARERLAREFGAESWFDRYEQIYAAVAGRRGAPSS